MVIINGIVIYFDRIMLEAQETENVKVSTITVTNEQHW